MDWRSESMSENSGERIAAAAVDGRARVADEGEILRVERAVDEVLHPLDDKFSAAGGSADPDGDDIVGAQDAVITVGQRAPAGMNGIRRAVGCGAGRPVRIFIEIQR